MSTWLGATLGNAIHFVACVAFFAVMVIIAEANEPPHSQPEKIRVTNPATLLSLALMFLPGGWVEHAVELRGS